METRTVSSPPGPRQRTRTVVKRKGRRKVKLLKRYLGTHQGVDLNAPAGTSIFAALPGQVLRTGFQRKGLGNFVVLDHGDGWTTVYGHSRRLLVAEGDAVLRGQVIAEVGSTGHSTGPHLHFELRRAGVPLDPLARLREALAAEEGDLVEP